MPEIDEIRIKETYIAVTLPPRERACYLELQQQVATRTLKLKSSKIQDSSSLSIDRVIFESESMLAALIKGCSYYPPTKSETQQSCKAILRQRRADLAKIDKDLQKHIEEAVDLRKETRRDVPDGNHLSIQLFDQFFDEILRNTPGDLDSSRSIRSMYEVKQTTVREIRELDRVVKRSKLDENSQKPAKTIKTKASKGEGKQSENASKLRNLIVELRCLTRSRVGCQRGLRFIENIFTIQQLDHHTGQIRCNSPKCQSGPLKRSQVSIIGICGHIICQACLAGRAPNSPCVAMDCPIDVSPSRLYSGSFLGRFEDRAYATEYRGKKIEDLIQLIGRIPEQEQVLLFVQFANLAEQVHLALADARIRVSFLKKNAQAAEILANFQKEEGSGQVKVLMCCIDDESASGS